MKEDSISLFFSILTSHTTPLKSIFMGNVRAGKKMELIRVIFSFNLLELRRLLREPAYYHEAHSSLQAVCSSPCQ